MKITAKQLRDKGACTYQVKVFDKEWPNGAQTTLKNLKRAAELGLDFDWFADTFLSSKQRKEYNEKKAPAGKEYDEKKAQAWKEYNEKKAQAWKEYDEKIAQARKEYKEKIAPARKEYNEKIARILFDILKRKR